MHSSDPNQIHADDPRLTAYALGELEGEERAAIAAAIARDPALQAAVDEIAATAQQLTSALASEPIPEAPRSAGELVSFAAAPARHLHSRPRTFPYLRMAGLAAAGFAVAFITISQLTEPPATETAPNGLRSRGVSRPPPALTLELPPVLAESSETESASNAPQTATTIRVAGPIVGAMLSPEEARSRSAPTSGTAVARLENVAGSEPPSGQGDAPAPTAAGEIVRDNEFQSAAENRVLTIPGRVGWGSYAGLKQLLLGGQRPPRETVRIEEWVNAFTYDYPGPTARDEQPFVTTIEVASAPWAPAHRLVRVGLKTRGTNDTTRPPANLVFLVDVSGSMAAPEKLPLVKQALRFVVERLDARDRVALAICAGNSGLPLPPTPLIRKAEVLAAIEGLQPGGSSDGAAGLRLAYGVARVGFIRGGINRVVFATDGDFNSGLRDRSELLRIVGEHAATGVSFTALGFGLEPQNGEILAELAMRGNGICAAIDSPEAARRVLAGQTGATLAPVAKDLQLDVQFNPTRVQSYRLIGYENAPPADEADDFDSLDASAIGAGHTLTALYEVVPVETSARGSAGAIAEVPESPTESGDGNASLLTVKVRYTTPDSDESKLIDIPVMDRGASFADASEDFKFAAAVAGFGMVLRDSPHRGGATLAAVAAWAREGRGDDPLGHRREFVDLIGQARALYQ